MKTILSVIGGILITLAIGLGINETAESSKPIERTITTSGGLTVKTGKITAELAQTRISVGSGVSIMVPLVDTAKEVASLLAEAGIKDTDMVQGNLTVCLASVVGYKTELNGYVSTKIAEQCRNFPAGMMAATVKTFAEDYTVAAVKEYKTKHTLIDKE